MTTLTIWKGILFGSLFGAGGILFVAASTLTDISRETWLVVNMLKGFLLFSLCFFCGMLIYKRTQRYREAIFGGIITGTCGSVITALSLYFFSFILTDDLKQYPFEFYSIQSSGAASFSEFMSTEKGRETVFETSIGIMPFVSLMAAFIGSILGAAGGFIARRKMI